MARRRRGGSAKTTRQTRRSKKTDTPNNGLGSSSENTLDDTNSLMDTDSANGGVNDNLNIGALVNCISDPIIGDPIVHHKKFGKIRMSGQNENSLDIDISTAETSKENSQCDSKSSDENDSEPSENNGFMCDNSVLDIMRGIEISGPKGRSSYIDFRKQSSVYKVENDIPLDGSVIIKPGTFSSNTISSSVKSNSFFNPTSTSEINPLNFFKVLEGIEMLERNVSSSLEFDRTLPKEEKDFLLESASPCTPTVYLSNDSENLQSKDPYVSEEMQLNNLKMDNEETISMTAKSIDELKVDEIIKTTDVSSPEDTSSDLPNETEETTRKLDSIVLDDRQELSNSPVVYKASEEAVEKKPSGFRSRTGSTDTTGSESSSNCGTAIRRSNRIKSIGMMKQKEREHALVKSDVAIKSPLPPGSPAVTPPVPGYDDKPVKVKSRWRRSSELEMHNGKGVDSEQVSSACSSPVNPPQTPKDKEPTPEELERIEKEKKDIEEGLNSFTILTENEYKMERTACKETRRMVCDCMLTKEEISRGEVGCGEDCLNRMLFLECGARCALGERCTNKRFQKLQYANCKIFKTEKKGFGLRAEENLAGNTFIMEYVGEVVNQKEFGRRVKMYAKDNNKHFYFMALKGDAIIDATNKGNISRFINHSCDPNAETQKWTINGELRVGFFTRRPVAAGEEITFDYQFQRYGKQAQKCFCEAPTCRGWIGENPDESLGNDDEEEDDDEDEEDEDEEEEEEEQEEDEEVEDATKKDIRKSTKNIEEKEKKEISSKPTKPAVVKVKKDRKTSEKKKERKTATIVDEMGLDEEINKLFQTGLKNRVHTLTLSRLMVRAEDWSTRGKLLTLIREGETPCRRLFLDYHGLRLICSWMLSRELEESSDKNERRLEILKTLSKLPIPNKNMLIDSKVLNVVEQWSKSVPVTRKISVDEESGNDENKKAKTEETIPGLGGEIDEKQNKEISNKEKEEEKGKETPMEIDKEKEDVESGEKVKRMALAVLESWSSLKEVFKIPKKERIEQMKEHERQADRGYKEYLDNKHNVREKYVRHDRYGRSDRYRDRDRDRDRDRIRDRKRMRESSPESEWFRGRERNSKLSKQERRQLFALKVLKEDEEAKKRNEHLEMWKQHESRCLALGLDPSLNTPCDPQTGFPMFFDRNSGTWQNCPSTSGPPPSIPHPVTPGICPSPMYPGNPLMRNCSVCPNVPFGSGMNHHIPQGVGPNGMMPNNQLNNLPMPNGPMRPGVSLPPCQGQPYPNMTPQFPPPPIPQPSFESTVPYQNPVLPEDIPLPKQEEEEEPVDPYQLIISETPMLNIPIKLPRRWKYAKDSKGRMYFYHVKDRISQWEPPPWPEDELRKEAMRIVALEMGEDSSSTESSSDTSTEDEDEEMESIKMSEDEKSLDTSQEATNGVKNENLSKESNGNEKSNERSVSSSEMSKVSNSLEEDKDEELSAWEDEEETVKSKNVAEKVPASTEHKSCFISANGTVQVPKIRRAGLVQEIIISPRREEDRVDNRKFKEVKEMLRRQKEEARSKEKLKMRSDKGNVRVSRNKKKKKDRPSRSTRTRFSSETSTERRIKEMFKSNMAGAIVSHLNPYRKQDCKVGRITCNEDFKHLARKLTHFVMLKELKHCKGIDDLECNDSVKAKAKDFIRKYMSKFGAVYRRPEHDVWKT